MLHPSPGPTKRRPAGTGLLLWLLVLLASAAPARALQTSEQDWATHAEAQKMRARRFLAHRGISAVAPQAAAQALARRQGPMPLAGNAPAISGTTWQPLGPAQITTSLFGPVTGRVTSVAVDPSDTSGNTVYIGTLGGGVWKSTNAAGPAGSVYFTPLTDDLPVFASALIASISIGAVSVQPTNRQVILAGTGDVNDALDSYFGVGILRSADGGNTWSLISNTQDGFNGGNYNYPFKGLGFAGFAWSTTSPSTVVAAVSSSLEGELVNAGTQQYMRGGLYYSTDAGQTWYISTLNDPNGQVIQGPNHTNSYPGNAATAVVWNPIRKSFFAAIRFHGYYSSPDGINWTRLANQPGPNLSASACPPDPGTQGNANCPIFRGALAVQPFTGDTFTLTTDINNNNQGLYQDVCTNNGLQATSCSSGVVTFGTQINSAAFNAGSGSSTITEADYNLSLAAVHSGQDTILLAGTQDLFRCSLANSCTWRNTTNVNTCAAAMVAPAQHSTDATFGANGLVYFGNDGGLWRSTDTVGQTGPVCSASDSSHFQNLNPGIGSLSEVEHISISSGSATTILAGVGEFGSAATSTGSGAWAQMLTGEGSFTAIDPANPQNWFADAAGGLAIYNCASGTGCGPGTWGTAPVVGYTQDQNDTNYFLEPAPWILDPEGSSNLLLGTCRVWRGPVNGANWSSANLLSSMLDGDPQSFCNGNAELRTIAAGLTGTSGQEQVYVGMAGVYDGGGAVPGHIFTSLVTTAQGQTTWTDLTNSTVANNSNQPKINPGGFAVSAIAVDPHDPTGQTVYVGLQGIPGNGISQGILFGSTNGGQTWNNITNNLSMPVNSIAPDPNTAGIVYVATDSGVFYTQNVINCNTPSSSCWSLYGSGLPNAPVTDLKIYNGTGGSVLEAATYGRGIWSLGLATIAAVGTLSPSSYAFPSQLLNTTSAPVTFTLQNTGSTAMSISQVETTGPYVQTNTCPGTLPQGARCTIGVSFAPTTSGASSGAVTVLANVASGQLQSTLTGTGVTPGFLSPNPASLGFSPTVEGASSAAQSVTFTNTGGSTAQLGTSSISSNYAIASSTCDGVALPVNGTCTISVQFAPTASGTLAGTLTLPSSNAQNGGATVPLSGTGLAPASLSFNPNPVNFPNTGIANSASQTVTVTNTGGVATPLGTPTASPGDFSITSTSCGSSLAASPGPGNSCTIVVSFSPLSTGTRNGLLSLPASGVSGGVATDPLTGGGLPAAAITYTPGSLSFPSTVINTTSAAQTLQIKNTGGSPLIIQSVTPSSGYAIPSGGNSCPPGLGVNSTCTVQVTFTPHALGDQPGTLTVVANTSPGTSTVSLDGSGISQALLQATPSSVTFPSTAQGTTSAPVTVSLSNSGGATAQLGTPAITGPFTIANTTCGSSLASTNTCSVSVAFAPTSSVTQATPQSGTLTVSSSNATGGGVSVPLSGNEVPVPTVTLSPGTVIFTNSVAEGSASPAMTVTATNTGLVSVSLGTPSASANFGVSSTTCGSTLPPGPSGNTCTISVIFQPAATGTLNGTLTLPGSMVSGQSTAQLQGSATTPGALQLQPASLTFASQVDGTTSQPQTATLSNTGGTSVQVGAIAVTGDSSFTLSSNTCGSSLGPMGTCTLGVTFSPSGGSSHAGALQVANPSTGNNLVTTLSGSSITPASLSFTPTSLGFGNVPVGSTSAAQTLVLANGGQAPATLQAPVVTGTGFTLAGTTCGTTLAGNASCSVSVTFTPASAATATGTVLVASNAPGSPTTAQLGGTGVQAGSLSLTPGSILFPTTTVGNSSATQTITGSNPGGVAVTLGSPSVSPNFSIAGNTCPASLNPNTTCTITLAFVPTQAGGLVGSFSYPGQFSSSPATVALSGLANTPGQLVLSPSSLTFAPVVEGQSSPSPQTITASNSGGTAITVSGVGVSGAGFAVVSNTCGGAVLAPNGGSGSPPAPQVASCTVAVQYAPTTLGATNGTLTVSANTAGGSSTALLSGTSISPGSPSLSSSSLTFPATGQGASSAPQQLTLTNVGGGTLTLSAPSVTGDYSLAGNTCPAVLASGASCAFSLVFTPSAAGDRPGNFATAVSSGPGQSQNVQARLDGTGLAPPLLTFTPASLAFGQVTQGKTSAAMSATLSNTGGETANLPAPVLTGDYSLSANSCGATLAPNTNCSVSVTFAPSLTGDRPGTLVFRSSNSQATATLNLDGDGLPIPYLILTPTTLPFPATQVGNRSSPEMVNIANTGTTTMNLAPVILAGQFVIIANTCTATLAPQYSCTVAIDFAPTTPGAQSGLLTVSDGTETHSATLTGTGLSSATDTLSPTSLSFGVQAIGTVSAGQSVTMSNTGGSLLLGISATVQGPFIATNNCGTQLGGGQSCTIAVAYAPTGSGAQTGVLTVSDAVRSQTIPLSGLGVGPPTPFAAPLTLQFGSYAVNQVSPTKTVTFTNNGQTDMNAIALVVDNVNFSLSATTCGSTLAAGASCTANIAFAPQSTDPAQGTLTLSSPSITAPLTVSLSGAGEDYTLAVVGFSGQTIVTGQTGNYQVSITPVGNSSGTITFSCSGLPANSTCNLNPTSMTLAHQVPGSLTVGIATGVTTTTTTSTSSNRRPGGQPVLHGVAPWLAGLAAAALMPCGLCSRRARRWLLLPLLLSGLLLLPTACGVHASGGKSSSSTAGGGSPAGSYQVTVTASFPGGQRSTTVTLIVE